MFNYRIHTCISDIAELVMLLAAWLKIENTNFGHPIHNNRDITGMKTNCAIPMLKNS